MLGVLVSVVDYRQVIDRLVDAAVRRRPLTVTALAVHGVMTAVHDRAYAGRLNGLDIVAPDGQPVRWALNLLHRAGVRDWVSGPDLVGRLLARAAADDLPVYLYGSTPDTVSALATRLRRRYAGLRVAGAEPSAFRTGGGVEVARLAGRIAGSGARIVLLGTGCPRQEVLASALAPRVALPVLAVGAAFDYHAGRLRPAPRWMQRYGLAWVARLWQEPRRLWRRYLLLGPGYLARLLAQRARVYRPAPVPAARAAPSSVPI
ncbi:WecB/TagA/CpsF family glycosyltransferase [Actinocatenispora rupis]|uniref:UDP-N-acetyl-D-mannosaminuronic acid transferase n=1 Tax=Actinocatenispora rupis TaxID=519421 RepID=A0A8J3IT77_9ACTN|nr:UDP-N-acetyl-D-mannosaminuronic acid transferase [Actinocatenispora rupis]